jgi:hypothetical protein
VSDPQHPPPGDYPASGNPPSQPSPYQPSPYQPSPYQPPPNQPPPYSAQAPYTMPPQAQDPGKTLGIIGLVLSFFTALIGMIISIIAFRSSKKAGFKNTPALAGIIIGAIFTVGAIIGTIALVAVLSKVAADCGQLGPGVHVVNGVTYTCG